MKSVISELAKLFKIIPYYRYKITDLTGSNVFETKTFKFGIAALISFLKDSRKSTCIWY